MAKKAELVDKPPAKSGGLYFSKPKTDIQFIRSGCTILDLALGGGWARRRVANVVGDSSSGKTLLMIEMAANFVMQEKKAIVRYRECEEAFDDAYAEALGFPLDKVDFGDPIDTIEDVFEDLLKVIEGARGPEAYIVDSLDSLSDREELARDIDKGTFGAAKAKKLSELFRRLIRALSSKDVTVFFVSQVRDNIGVMIGKKHTRSGGKALQFYSSQVLWLSQIGKIVREVKGIKRATGVNILAKVDKNKIGLPYREAQFPIKFAYGIDDYRACTDFLKTTKTDFSKDVPIEDLQRLVSDKWWEIEREFLPDDGPKYRRE